MAFPGPGDVTLVQEPAAIEATVLRTYPATGPSDPVTVDVLVSAEQAVDLVSMVATGRIGVVLTSRGR